MGKASLWAHNEFSRQFCIAIIKFYSEIKHFSNVTNDKFVFLFPRHKTSDKDLGPY